MKKILIIEDEPNIRELIKYNVSSNGFETAEADNGEDGLSAVYEEKPDLILLDIMLPGKDGYEVCRELHESGNHTPIIMLTAKTEESDKVRGLDAGADDYISKPFGVRELLARINAVLRRSVNRYSEEIIENSIVIGDIRIDNYRHEVTARGREIDLTNKEFELLALLAGSPGRVFTRDEILNDVWGIDFAGETRTVDVHIRYLRRKLGEDGKLHIETVRGKGYRII